MIRPLAFLLVACSTFSLSPAILRAEPTTPPWDQRVRIDPVYRHHFSRADGSPVFILNKTAWHYFRAREPRITLRRAQSLGANVLRVALETRLYHPVLGLDAWPWGGTREQPDFTSFNEPYWDQVDERLRLAAAHGIGVNLTLFTSLHLPDTAESFEKVKPYLDRVLTRLGRHPNIFCWEIHNEWVQNPTFQAQVGAYLKTHDSTGRPVISSNGTTDYPLWPHAAWMDLALVHHCTGAQPQYDLRDWYLAIARNLRVHGKPAFNNETGREVRHGNDDPVHRRKQLWIAAAAGGYTTWHSWDGCEGIDDETYVAPGQEFVRPFTHWWRAQEFWRVDPDFSVAQAQRSGSDAAAFEPVALTAPSRDLTLIYCFTRESGALLDGGNLSLRLPDGDYQVEFFNPADGSAVGEPRLHVSPGLRRQEGLALPAFRDDLAIRLTRVATRDQTAIPGTL